jgi:hypothetical protein
MPQLTKSKTSKFKTRSRIKTLTCGLFSYWFKLNGNFLFIGAHLLIIMDNSKVTSISYPKNLLFLHGQSPLLGF